MGRCGHSRSWGRSLRAICLLHCCAIGNICDASKYVRHDRPCAPDYDQITDKSECEAAAYLVGCPNTTVTPMKSKNPHHGHHHMPDDDDHFPRRDPEDYDGHYYPDLGDDDEDIVSNPGNVDGLPGCYFGKSGALRLVVNGRKRYQYSFGRNDDEPEYHICRQKRLECCPPLWVTLPNLTHCGYADEATKKERIKCERACRDTFHCEGFAWSNGSNCTLYYQNASGLSNSTVADEQKHHLQEHHHQSRQLAETNPSDNQDMDGGPVPPVDLSHWDDGSDDIGYCRREFCRDGWTLERVEGQKIQCGRAESSCYEQWDENHQSVFPLNLSARKGMNLTECAWSCDQDQMCHMFIHSEEDGTCILQNNTNDHSVSVAELIIGHSLYSKKCFIARLPMELDLALPLGHGALAQLGRELAHEAQDIKCQVQAGALAEATLVDAWGNLTRTRVPPPPSKAQMIYYVPMICLWIAVLLWARWSVVAAEKEIGCNNQQRPRPRTFRQSSVSDEELEPGMEGSFVSAERIMSDIGDNDGNRHDSFRTGPTGDKALLPLNQEDSTQKISSPRMVEMTSAYEKSSVDDKIQAAAPQVVSSGRKCWPQHWGITRDQCKTLLETLRQDPKWNSNNTIHDLVHGFLEPWTSGKGLGYALFLNQNKPKLVNVVVVHAWDGNAEEFLELLVRCLKPKDAAFSMAISMYHCEDSAGPSIAEQMGPKLDSAPSVVAMQHIAATGKTSILWQSQHVLANIAKMLVALGALILLIPTYYGCLPVPNEETGSIGSLQCLSLGNSSLPSPINVAHWHIGFYQFDSYSLCVPLGAPLVICPGLFLLMLWLFPPYAGRILIISSYECDMWRKLRCVYELAQARILGLPAQIAKTLCSMTCDCHSDTFWIAEAETRQASCTNPVDDKRIRAQLERFAAEGIIRPVSRGQRWCLTRLVIELCMRCCVGDGAEWNHAPADHEIKDWNVYKEMDAEIERIQDDAQITIIFSWCIWASWFAILIMIDFGLRYHYSSDVVTSFCQAASFALFVRFASVFVVGSITGARTNGRRLLKWVFWVALAAMMLNVFAQFVPPVPWQCRGGEHGRDYWWVVVHELSMAVEFTFLPLLLVGFVCGRTDRLAVVTTVFSLFMLDPYMQKQALRYDIGLHPRQALTVIQLLRHIVLPHLHIWSMEHLGVQIRTWGCYGDTRLGRRYSHELESREREKAAQARRARATKQRVAARKTQWSSTASKEDDTHNAEVHLLRSDVPG